MRVPFALPTAARRAPIAALAAAVVLGTITDRTTAQPLVGVHVSVGTARATTKDDGTYRLVGVKPGAATVRLTSDDVPPQSFSIVVGTKTTHVDLKACSTTLDYSCGVPQ